MNEKTLYVALEGIDGVGKTTLFKNLIKKLEENSYPFVKTREPTDEKYGKEIRERAVNGPSMSAEEELTLFVKDRKQHTEELLTPTLFDPLDPVILLQDRTYLSTVAYQASRPDSAYSPEYLLEINEFAPRPDIVILLDLDVDTALERISSERETDDFENKERLEKTREIYLELAKTQKDTKFFVLNATLSPEVLTEVAYVLITKLFMEINSASNN